MHPIILNYIREFLLPFFMKSPPQMAPRATPKTELVERRVVLKLRASVSQLYYYFKAGMTGPI